MLTSQTGVSRVCCTAVVEHTPTLYETAAAVRVVLVCTRYVKKNDRVQKCLASRVFVCYL